MYWGLWLFGQQVLVMEDVYSNSYMCNAIRRRNMKHRVCLSLSIYIHSISRIEDFFFFAELVDLRQGNGPSTLLHNEGAVLLKCTLNYTQIARAN